jgi:uncharacterized protein YecE (DUF72 family)
MSKHMLICGTSGFAYPTWKPGFYPEKLPARRFLEYYATRLNGLEVNYTYRTLPSAKILEGWIATTGPDFIFCPKAHQKLTHIGRLTASPFTQTFLGSLEPLREAGRLGPILFQLPPNFPFDEERLRSYLESLPKAYRYAIEFRHESWLNEDVYKILENHQVALCIAESEKLIVPRRVTAPFSYFRLRIPEMTEHYRQQIAEDLKQMSSAGVDVYAFFKHEDDPTGALYAEEVLKSAATKPAV